MQACIDIMEYSGSSLRAGLVTVAAMAEVSEATSPRRAGRDGVIRSA
jgi:hypothetical protein